MPAHPATARSTWPSHRPVCERPSRHRPPGIQVGRARLEARGPNHRREVRTRHPRHQVTPGHHRRHLGGAGPLAGAPAPVSSANQSSLADSLRSSAPWRSLAVSAAGRGSVGPPSYRPAQPYLGQGRRGIGMRDHGYESGSSRRLSGRHDRMRSGSDGFPAPGASARTGCQSRVSGTCGWSSASTPAITTGAARTWRCSRHRLAGRPVPPVPGADVRVLRRDRPGGLIREYSQVA